MLFVAIYPYTPKEVEEQTARPAFATEKIWKISLLPGARSQPHGEKRTRGGKAGHRPESFDLKSGADLLTFQCDCGQILTTRTGHYRAARSSIDQPDSRDDPRGPRLKSSVLFASREHEL